MSEAMLSVIIPVYNTEKYIEECLDSVLSQNVSGTEIFCIDDNSTDRSPEILQRYADEHKNIHILGGGGQGVSHARNKGLSKANGEHILFLDSDDYLEPGCLPKLLERSEKDKLDLLYYSYENFEDGNLEVEIQKKTGISMLKGVYDENRIKTGREVHKVFSSNGDFMSVVWNAIIRKQLITDNGIQFAEGMVFEDGPYSLELMLSADRVVCLNSVCYHRRIRGGSIMHTTFSGYHLHSFLRSCLLMYEVYDRHQSLLGGNYGDYSPLMTKRIRTLTRYYTNITNEEYEQFRKLCTPSELIMFDSLIQKSTSMIEKRDMKIETLTEKKNKFKSQRNTLREENKRLKEEKKKLKADYKQLKAENKALKAQVRELSRKLLPRVIRRLKKMFS